MEYDYYKHRNRCYIDNYFDRIGIPIKVSYIQYTMLKNAGYRTTRVPQGTSITEVIVAAAIASGAHPSSYKVEKIRETGADE